MKHKQSMDLSERLEREFDAASVELALEQIGTNVFTTWFLPHLQKGRGAALLMPRITETLKQQVAKHPTSAVITRSSAFLTENELDDALSKAELDESAVVEQIRNGKNPNPYLLPAERRLGLYQSLRSLISLDEFTEESKTILEYLLSAEQINNKIASAETRELATNWCVLFCGDTRIQNTLRHLMWMSPSPEIVRIAEAHMERAHWTIDTMLLLTSIMRTRGGDKIDRWVERWLNESEPSDQDGYVVAEYVKTSNCSRRSLRVAKFAISGAWGGAYWALLALISFSHRKPIDRWLKRGLRKNLRIWSVLEAIPKLLEYRPSKLNCELATEALKVAGTKQRQQVLMELVRHTADSEVLLIAKRQIEEFPDAPASFELMLCIAKTDPELAIPWLLEWNKTALANQVCLALIAVVKCSSSPEHLRLAKDFLREKSSEITWYRRAWLVCALLKREPTTELIDIGSKILETEAEKQHPAARKLTRCVVSAEQRILL